MGKFIFQKMIINKLYVFSFTWGVRIYYFVTLGSHNLWQYQSQDERSMLKVKIIKKSVYFYSPVIILRRAGWDTWNSIFCFYFWYFGKYKKRIGAYVFNHRRTKISVPLSTRQFQANIYFEHDLARWYLQLSKVFLLCRHRCWTPLWRFLPVFLQ